ncbi:MAG: D-2-hydroxyacid dehydrogenase [Lachnospiraceae bacterium]|nr:D-2-hydroxyacid dehydrogenase [Lachnospiraceae bacterium]MCI9133147.1 D-2-hydroxyacid dehydrogenase [Lachnospiraceae bacterium]
MKKILVAVPVEERHKEYLETQVQGAREEFVFVYKELDKLTQEDLADANIVLGAVPPRLLSGAGKLEWLQLSSAGADNYLKPGILGEQVYLTNSVGAYGLTVSEHMLAVTFALIRRLNQYARNQAAHVWKQMGTVISVENSTVLVLGMGDIGGSYARKMKALGAYVIGIRKTDREKPTYVDEQYTMEALEEVIGRADIVAMVLPGGEDTAHLMDEAMLRRMKKGSFLINDGRGNAVDLVALKRVLDEGHLAGAALDVTEPEPLPAEDSLWDYENVILTPHIAGQLLLAETRERVIRIAGENLRCFARGEALTHVVKRDRGY